MAAPVGVKSHPRRIADGFNADSKTESALVVACVLLCNRVRGHNPRREPLANNNAARWHVSSNLVSGGKEKLLFLLLLFY